MLLESNKNNDADNKSFLFLYSHVLQQIHEKISGNFADTPSHQLVKNEWLDKNNLFHGLKHLSSD